MAIPPIQPGSPSFHPQAVASPISAQPPMIRDVLMTSNSSCPQWLTRIGNQIQACFEKVKNWIRELFGIKPAELHSSTLPVVVKPTQAPCEISNPNKIYAYNLLVSGRDMSRDSITVEKLTLNHPETLENLPVFYLGNAQITQVNGPFLYDDQTAATSHWTANFADSNLFGFCEGPLLAQDELQVLEHPALAHIKHALPSNLRHLRPYEAVFFQNVPRLGRLDTSTPLANGQTLYGNRFATASQAEIHSRLTRFANPTHSNIFAIAAPHISPSLNGQPYQRKDLEKLFFTAYNAFLGIREISDPGKRIVVHSGNWGAGAFGNDPKTVHLIQIAAAKFAGVHELRMHPMSSAGQFQSANQLLGSLETTFPQMTIGQFLDHLTTNAAAYNLRYGIGNGT